MAWTTPRTWVAGETVTAAIMNTYVRDEYNAMATWTDVTFSTGNFVAQGGGSITIASGNVTTNRYLNFGNVLIWQFDVTGFTVTGTVTEVRMTLPTASVAKTGRSIIQIEDNSVFGDGLALASTGVTGSLRVFATVSGTVNFTASAGEGMGGTVFVSV